MGKLNYHDTRKQTIVELQNQIWARERGVSEKANRVYSTGCEDLDALLPHQGIRRGSLVEWVGSTSASRAGTLSLIAGKQICPQVLPTVIIDVQHELFPLSLSLLGFDLSRVVLIRPNSEKEALWACEEALRSEAIGVVWANIERMNSTSFRRLQLAVEASAGIGFLVRSAQALKQPSWAEARLLVHPLRSLHGSPCVRVELASSYRKLKHSQADIVIDSVKGTLYGTNTTANPLPLVSQLGVTATYQHSA
nr:hypothetical protein [Bremerella cremea]